MRISHNEAFQSPDERGGYCDLPKGKTRTRVWNRGFNPLTSGAGTATFRIRKVGGTPLA